MYETINSPINYGGLELKNRIIFAPTTFGLAEDEYFEKIRKIAAGGCAMVIIGDVPVGKSQFEKSLFDKKGFAHYQKLVEIVHSYDCRICAQLHQTDSNMLAMLKYVPGVLTKKISMEELRPLLNAEVAPYISKLSTRKIHKIINGFGEAAVLAVQAGNDLLCSTDYAEQYNAVLSAVLDGRIDFDALNASVMRVLKWKQNLGLL